MDIPLTSCRSTDGGKNNDISVSGGQGESSLLSSTEIFEDGNFVSGPKLPLAVSGHCMLEVNYTHSLLTLGVDGIVSLISNVYC